MTITAIAQFVLTFSFDFNFAVFNQLLVRHFVAFVKTSLRLPGFANSGSGLIPINTIGINFVACKINYFTGNFVEIMIPV